MNSTNHDCRDFESLSEGSGECGSDENPRTWICWKGCQKHRKKYSGLTNKPMCKLDALVWGFSHQAMKIKKSKN
jgi:hypothetical protein